MTTDTLWQLPIEEMLVKHRARIDGHEDQVPAMVETWHVGDVEPSWTTWIGDTGDFETRDIGLHAVSVMARITEADYVLFSFDTHMSKTQNNPETGQPWGHGEMQRMCDTVGYCETGNIRDNLVLSIVRRSDAKLYFHSIPYHFHKGELILYPDETIISEWDSPDTQSMDGTIPKAMRAAVQQPNIAKMMADMGLDPARFGLDRDDALLHQILAGVRILNRAAVEAGQPDMFMCVIPAKNEDQAEVIRRSMAESGMEAQKL